MKNISEILTSLVIDNFECVLIKNLIKCEYFYFSLFEQNQIADITITDLKNPEECVYEKNYRCNLLCKDFYEYLSAHHSLVLKGFITFRIRNYLELLLEQIDKSVNKHIVQKEYNEFISLLKLYVSSEQSSVNIVHLIYHNCKSTLLDENKNAINTGDDIFSAKYLSDISFSSNDYALNTLLNIIPQKIYIHLIDGIKDEFINTIKLIFENKVTICTDCSICKIYKKSPALHS